MCGGTDCDALRHLLFAWGCLHEGALHQDATAGAQQLLQPRGDAIAALCHLPRHHHLQRQFASCITLMVVQSMRTQASTRGPATAIGHDCWLLRCSRPPKLSDTTIIP